MKLYLPIIFFLLIASDAISDISIIVHKDNTNTFTHKEIRKIFLGKMTYFSNGKQAVPIVQKGNLALWEEFTEKVLNKSPESARIYWAKKLFSGKGKPPKQYETSQEIISKVKNDIKYIGIINSSEKISNVKLIPLFP